MRTTADPVPTGTQTLPNPKATEGTLLGCPDLRQQSPELALLLIAFDFTLPMALWMRLRG